MLPLHWLDHRQLIRAQDMAGNAPHGMSVAHALTRAVITQLMPGAIAAGKPITTLPPPVLCVMQRQCYSDTHTHATESDPIN